MDEGSSVCIKRNDGTVIRLKRTEADLLVKAGKAEYCSKRVWRARREADDE